MGGERSVLERFVGRKSVPVVLVPCTGSPALTEFKQTQNTIVMLIVLQRV